MKVIYKKSVSTSHMSWSKEEFRTVIWHTKITCKITQKVVLPLLVLHVRGKNTIKIEKKIVKKRYYLDLLNEGSGRGGAGQGDGFELVCGNWRGACASSYHEPRRFWPEP